MTFTGIGILGAAANIANTIIGGVLIELPNIMKIFGVFVTLFVLLIIYSMTMLSLKFLLKSKDLSGKSDYKSLTKFAFEAYGAQITDFCIFFNNYGVCIGYLIIF